MTHKDDLPIMRHTSLLISLTLAYSALVSSVPVHKYCGVDSYFSDDLYSGVNMYSSDDLHSGVNMYSNVNANSKIGDKAWSGCYVSIYQGNACRDTYGECWAKTGTTKWCIFLVSWNYECVKYC